MTSLAPTTGTTVSTLAARIRRGDAQPLLSWLGADGVAWLPESGMRFVTAGAATTVAANDAASLLGTIDLVDGTELGAPELRPIAAGAIGWRLDRPLVVPARTVFEIDGEQWVLEIDRPAVEPDRPERPTRVARHFEVDALQDQPTWVERVGVALEQLASRGIEKLVLAREVHVRADVAFDRLAILERLRRDQPGCVVYAAGDLVGASPELLVARFGESLQSRPMAGTVARRANVSDDDRAVARLLASAKEANEHALVVDAVVRALHRLGLEPEIAGPSAQRFSSVTHLVTEVVAGGHDLPDAASLAVHLHPTPAVGGTPTAEAVELLESIEGFDRDVYAGPVGWVDSTGDGAFMVALRGATLSGRDARVIAGAGIVADSDPIAEWDETQAKLEPVLRALVRP